MVLDAWTNKNRLHQRRSSNSLKNRMGRSGYDVENKISELFEPSQNATNFLTASEVKPCVQRLNVDISPTKIGRIMTKIGCKAVDKKINGKTIKVHMGIQQINQSNYQ